MIVFGVWWASVLNLVFGQEELVSRVLRVGEEKSIRMWGRLSNFTDSTGTNHSHVTFLGIPFAISPIKHLRFQRPSMKILDADFKALTPAPPCPQLTAEGVVIGDEEECLILNIIMPLKGNTKDMPVLYWLHGESKDRVGRLEPFTSGSASEVFPQVFIPGSIVIVLPQFRIGSLGYLNTVNEDLSGNMQLFDQLLGLEWVQRFIPFFKGDKNQVSLMGTGSSAISAGLLATSPLSRSLFHRIILMGGSPLSPIAIDPTPKLTYAEIALHNSCPSFPTSAFVRCMQGRRLSSLLSADLRLVKGRHLGRMKLPLPVIQKEADGRFLPPILFRNPSQTLSEGAFEPVPLIIGVSSSEMQGYLPSLTGKSSLEEVKVLSSEDVLNHFLRSLLARNYKDSDLIAQFVSFEYFAGLNITQRQEQAQDLLEEMLSDYLFFVPSLSMAKLWSKYGPVYFYVFDHTTEEEGIIPPVQGAPNHGSDVEFLMNGYKASSIDREISSIFVSLLTNFIHKGSPLNSGIDWPQWREETQEFLLIGDDEVEVSSGFRKRQNEFWSSIVPTLSNNKCGKSSLVAGNRRSKGPLVYKDVSELDASNTFFTYGSLQ